MPVYTINGKTILFIHIPKTAGMALNAELSAAGTVRFNKTIEISGHRLRPRHAHAALLEDIYDQRMFDYVFAVVRHPVERAISEFRYQSRKPGLHLAGILGFDHWLSYCLARRRGNPSYRDNHFRPQSEFPAFNAAIFRYEDGLDKPLQAVGQVTGYQFPPLPAEKNASPKVNVTLSENSKALIHSLYRDDFEQFGYAPRLELAS